jgi:hypothetical protein
VAVAGGCSNTTVTFSNPSERSNAASAAVRGHDDMAA